MMFAHIHAFQAGPHEGWSQPSDHGEGCAECQPAKRERSDEWVAITLEGVGEDGDTSGGEGEEGKALGLREASGRAMVILVVSRHRWVCDRVCVGFRSSENSRTSSRSKGGSECVMASYLIIWGNIGRLSWNR